MKNLFVLRKTAVWILFISFCLIALSMPVMSDEGELDNNDEVGEVNEVNEAEPEQTQEPAPEPEQPTEPEPEQTTEAAPEQPQAQDGQADELPQTGIDNIVPLLAIIGITVGFLIIILKEVFLFKKKSA